MIGTKAKNQHVLNLPLNKIKTACGEAKKLRLFCVSVIIKEHFEFSTLHYKGKNPIRVLMGILHCGYYQAKEILEDIKESPLFCVCEEKGVIFAKPLRSGEMFQFKKCAPTKKDFVYKLEYDKSQPHTLRELKKVVRRIMLMNRVLGKQRATFKAKEKNVELSLRRQVLRQGTLAREIGLSKSSVSRYLKTLRNDKIVSKSEIVAECVIPHLTDETSRQWYEKHPNHGRFIALHNDKAGVWQGWVTYGCVYSLDSQEEERKFLHVLYNHKKRVGTRYVKKVMTIEDRLRWMEEH